MSNINWTTVGLLVLSNLVMLYAWYGHLRSLSNAPVWAVILVSWLIALGEYCLMVPANRMGARTMSLEQLKIVQLSEKNRRLVVIVVQGVARAGGSLLPEYTEDELQEATFSFVKYYVQGRHYDELVAENEQLKKDLQSEIDWRNRVSEI